MGPYTVVKELQNNNYLLDTPDRRKSQQLLHVNRLRSYHTRSDSKPVLNVSCVVTHSTSTSSGSSPDFDSMIPSWSAIKNSEILTDIGGHYPELSHTHRKELTKMFNKWPTLFTDIPRICPLIEHDITLQPNTHPIRQPSYRVSPKKIEIMRKEVDYLVSNGLAVPSVSPWASPSLLVGKEDRGARLCTDYRRLNSVTIPDAYPIPRVDDLIDSVGQATIMSKIDLLKGYYQVPLTQEAREKSAFITPFGLYEYTVMSFGLKNAPSTFQRLINNVIRDLPGVLAYLDDILVIAHSEQEHSLRLGKLLETLDKWNFTINLKKSTFYKANVTYLGHIVGSGVVKPKIANVEAILTYPVPTEKKQLQRFLGMAGYYRRFCLNFASIAFPLTNLTRKSVDFVWSNECQEAYDNLKCFLTQDPVLKSPDFQLPFFLYVDACETGTGAVLMQPQVKEGLQHPVCY